MTTYRSAVSGLLILAIPMITMSDDAVEPWPDQVKKAAVAGCRQSIKDRAMEDYAKRLGVTREELPDDIRMNRQLSSFLNSMMNVCDCAMDKISMEMSAEYFNSHPREVSERFNQIAMSGECTMEMPEVRFNDSGETIIAEPPNQADCDDTTRTCTVEKFTDSQSNITINKD